MEIAITIRSTRSGLWEADITGHDIPATFVCAGNLDLLMIDLTEALEELNID